VFTIRDYFEARLLPPRDKTSLDGYSRPSKTIYDYVAKRLFDSFNLPLGPTRYLTLMSPDLPDHETIASQIGLAPHGRAWVMIKEEWPKIKQDLDNGVLSPLGLVTLKSRDPFELGKNHQVLAYGYDLTGSHAEIYLYDPNHPDDDTVTMSLDLGDPMRTTKVTYSTGETVICFFRDDYRFSAPPVTDASQYRFGQPRAAEWSDVYWAPAEFFVSPAFINTGIAWVDTRGNHTMERFFVRLWNIGSKPIRITFAYTTTSVFKVSVPPGTVIGAHHSYEFEGTFSPNAAGNVSGTLIVNVDLPAKTQLRVELRGVGEPLPAELQLPSR
jgi:hypothetical protein